MDQTKYTTITIDKSTASRLKELAGDSPLTRYLRELSQSLTGEIASPIEKRLANIEFKLDMWNSGVKNMTLKTDADFHGIFSAFMKLDSSGELLKGVFEESAGYEYDNRQRYGLGEIENEFRPPDDRENNEEKG